MLYHCLDTQLLVAHDGLRSMDVETTAGTAHDSVRRDVLGCLGASLASREKPGHPGQSRIVMMAFTNKICSIPTHASGKSRGGAARIVGTSLLGCRI